MHLQNQEVGCCQQNKDENNMNMNYLFVEEHFLCLEEQPVFGVPLSVAVERSRCHDGVEIPLVVRDCIDYIQEVGLNVEGLYKVSGKSKAQSLRRLYNQRESVNIADYDIPVATSLLKTFLRELPEPLLTTELLPKFEEAALIKEAGTRAQELKLHVDKLPNCNRQLLAWLIKHFHDVIEHEKNNKMSSQNLATAMSTVIQASQKLISVLLSHCDTLFPDCKLVKYIPPLSCGSPSLPETKEAITEELRKQESLLGQLHSEMHAGICTKNREEQLWEVQRIITQLKRKLRGLERAAESTQRSVEEPEEIKTGGITQQQPQSPNQLVVRAVVENTAEQHHNISGSDTVDNKPPEKSWEAKKEELFVTLETEELTNLARSLQTLIEREKSDLISLKSQIRALGGTPVTRSYLPESIDDENISEGMVIACQESSTLQAQKETLISSLIEEQFACVDLRVQIKLAQICEYMVRLM